MITTFRRRAAAATAAAALAFGLVSCADDAGTSAEGNGATETIQVEDNQGTQTVALPLDSVISTDNRTFRTLEDWGVELSAAPVGLMPENLGYKTDDSIVDLGNHREPNLEAIVAAEPDLIINGQRFAQYYGNIKALTPDTPILDVEVREG
uniref:ABC transporter substrate-binding protein n=1 Tax=uncultured Corynebacterium sp. TaxID=159447 RepID=UPI00261C8CDC